MAAWSDPLSMPRPVNAIGLDGPSGSSELLSWFAPGINGSKLFGGGSSISAPIAEGASAYGMGAGGMMGLNPNSKNFAQNAFAALTRQQWDDYLSNYVPEENRLINYATDETKPQDASYLAGRGIGAAFDQQRASTDRRLAGMGMTLNPEERAAADKQSRLSESLATVGAMNNARDATVQRQQSVIGSPAPKLPQGGFQ